MERLLIALALFKVQSFLAVGLRLRTACDLDVAAVRITRPGTFAFPTLDALRTEMPELIAAVAARGMFNEPRAVTVTFS